jgi:hypothetical protein
VQHLRHIRGLGTINRDLHWFLEKTRKENANFIERIQEVHEKSMTGLNVVIKEGWVIIENAADNKEKLDALALVKDCYALQEELSCNLPIIDEALKFDGEGQDVDDGVQPVRVSNQSEVAGGGDIDGIGVRKQEGVRVGGACEGEQVGQQKVKQCDTGEKDRKDDIQGSEEKVREDQKGETTNKTF